MKKWILGLLMGLQCMLHADVIVYYSVNSDIGDSWIGEIVVADLDANSTTAISITAEELPPAGFGDFASATGWLAWTDINDLFILYVKSSTLYDTIRAGGAWNTPWSDLIGNSYAIADEDYAVEFIHPDEPVNYSGRGGEISFSLIPEPATFGLMLMAGGMLALIRRRC